MRFRIVSCVLLLTLSATGSAQVYKVIGPDGKVSYTDRPPSEANANVQVIRSGVAAPVSTAAPPAAPARQPLPSEWEKARLLPALRVVLGKTALVEGSMAICMETLPTSMQRYLLAQVSWKRRNDQILGNANAMLETVFAAERAQLEEKLRASADLILQPVRQSEVPRRIAWCDRSVKEIEGDAFDLARNLSVTPLTRTPPP
jgi:hypothetical protein